MEIKAKEAKDKQDLIIQGKLYFYYLYMRGLWTHYYYNFFKEKQKELELINLAKKAQELFDLLDANKDLL